MTGYGTTGQLIKMITPFQWPIGQHNHTFQSQFSYLHRSCQASPHQFSSSACRWTCGVHTHCYRWCHHFHTLGRRPRLSTVGTHTYSGHTGHPRHRQCCHMFLNRCTMGQCKKKKGKIHGVGLMDFIHTIP